MASEPLLAAFDMAVVRRSHSVRSGVLSDYWALSKPEVNFLIAIATLAAFYLGCPTPLAHFP
jgi:heme O synthase-like polyprenyltransferase